MEIIIKGIGLLLAVYVGWEIFRLFFWDIWEGRISRSTFILITLSLFSPLLLMFFKPELIDSEFLTNAWMGLVGIYILYPVAFNIAILFISSNVMAKRFRDAGGAGWTLTIIWTVILIAIPENLGNVLSLLVILYLFIAPTSKVA